MSPLVCVFAHPDDEAFGPGGYIALEAKKRDVYIICVTQGNAFGNHNLESIRKEELLRSAKILGVKKVDFLGYDDGSLCNLLYHKLAEEIRSKLDEYQPSSLLTFNINGISGHLDHITVALITTFVFQKIDYAKELLYYSEIEEVIKTIEDYFIYIPPGVKKCVVDMTVDVSSVWEIKEDAMKQHKSQQKDVDELLNLWEKFPHEEHFMRLEKKSF
jgi:N-acetylglucosamine malate deacetylase 2